MSHLQNWNPFKEFEAIQNNWPNSFMTPFFKSEKEGMQFSPALDIAEDKECFTVKIELPEMKKEDIKVECHENVLTISGEKKFEKETKNTDKKYHRVERSYGNFMRSFSLPISANADQVMAEYNSGVLEVKIAKKALTQAQNKQIPVK